MGKVDCRYLPRKVVYRTERLIVVTLVEKLHLIRTTASCYNQVLIFLAELTCVQQTRCASYLYTIPVQSLVKLAFSRFPLLQLIVLPPGSSQQVHSTVSYSIATDIGSKNALNRLAVSRIPCYKSLIPSPRVDQMLILRITVEFGAVDSVGVAVVRSVGLLQLQLLFTFDLIVNAHNRLTSCCE